MKDERTREVVYNVTFLFIGLFGVLFRIVFPDIKTPLAIVAAGCFSYNVFHALRKGYRLIAFKTNSEKTPWQRNAEILGRQGLWMSIPRSAHRKGPKPKVKIANAASLLRRTEFDIKVSPHGDVTIYYPDGYFVATITGPDYLEVEITGE